MKNAVDYRNHLLQVAGRVSRIKEAVNPVFVGFDGPIENYQVIGYLHKTRLHKSKLKLSDCNYVRYLSEGSDGYHYAEAEVCQLEGRVNQQIIKKILIIKKV